MTHYAAAGIAGGAKQRCTQNIYECLSGKNVWNL